MKNFLLLCAVACVMWLVMAYLLIKPPVKINPKVEQTDVRQEEIDQFCVKNPDSCEKG